MIDYLKSKMAILQRELEIYEDLRLNAENEELADRAMELGRETLAQIWAARKEQEEQKPKGLYYSVTET